MGLERIIRGFFAIARGTGRKQKSCDESKDRRIWGSYSRGIPEGIYRLLYEIAPLQSDDLYLATGYYFKIFTIPNRETAIVEMEFTRKGFVAKQETMVIHQKSLEELTPDDVVLPYASLRDSGGLDKIYRPALYRTIL